MTTNTNAALAEDLQDAVSKALRRAWQLGQTYWQQADSEYTSQHRKADETQGKFDALVEETRAALSTAAQPPAAQGDALPREEFAWMVVQEACETEPADEDDPECIRILRRDLKSAVLAAFLREDAARIATEGDQHG